MLAAYACARIIRKLQNQHTDNGEDTICGKSAKECGLHHEQTDNGLLRGNACYSLIHDAFISHLLPVTERVEV